MVAFIVNVLRDRKDPTEVIYYLRDNGKSFTIIQREPHIIVSEEKSNEETERILGELSANSEYKDFAFEVVPFGANKSFIQAIGPPDKKNILPSLFYTDNRLNKPTEMTRWHHPPLSIVDVDDRVLTTEKIISIDDLLNERMCVIDVELEDWDTDDPKIMSAVLYTGSDFGNYVFIVYDPKVDMIKDSNIIVCNDQNYLVQQLTEYVQEFDPLFVGGHNIPQDEKWLRDYPDEQFYRPGVDEAWPIIKSATREEIRKMFTPGRFKIDTYRYARTYLNFLEDNKLDTHYRRAGGALERIVDFDIDYKELKELTERAKVGDTEAARRIAGYTRDDGEISLLLMRHLLPEIALKMRVFHTDSDTVCAKSRFGLNADRWRRRYFLRTGTFDDRKWGSLRYYPTPIIRKQEDIKVSMEKITMDLLQGELSKMEKNHLLTNQSGFYEEIHVVYLTPFVNAYSPIINRDEDLLSLIFTMKRRQDSDSRIDIAQTLNAALVVPTLKLQHFLTRAGYQLGQYIHSPEDIREDLQNWDYAFGKAHGINFRIGDDRLLNANCYTLNKGIEYAIHGSRMRKGIIDLLEELDVVHHTPNLLFLKGDIDIIKEYAKQYLLIYQGSGPAISTPTKIVANVGNTPIYQGFLPKRGRKSNFEINLMLEFIERAFGGESQENLYKFLDQSMLALESGRVPKSDLVYRTNKECYVVIAGCNRRRVREEDFLGATYKPNVEDYKLSIREHFGDIFYATLTRYKKELDQLFAPRSPQLGLFD